MLMGNGLKQISIFGINHFNRPITFWIWAITAFMIGFGVSAAIGRYLRF